MKKIRLLEQKKPVCFFNDQLMLSDNDKLYSLHLGSLEIEFLASIPGRLFNRLLGRNRYLSRLLRLGVRCAAYNAGKINFVFDNKMYCYDVSSRAIVQEFIFDAGKIPLAMTVVERSFGNFESGIYFGEYFNNPNKDQVGIYFKSTADLSWRRIYSFPKGAINHVHAIIPDPARERMWILTGDFDQAAGIWAADLDFRTVHPVAFGKQTYRACVAFPVPQGLIYATDSQLENNYICLLRETDGCWESRILHAINGSCIYGCRWGDNFVFSTSTEPGEERTSLLLTLMDKKPGPGILKNESHLLLMDKKFNLTLVDVKKKDWFPYRLFQFGSIMFPGGHNDSRFLFSYSVANVDSDLSTEVWIMAY